MKVKHFRGLVNREFYTRNRFFVNRKVKDRLFRFIFEQDREALLQLYNALNGTDYQDASQLKIVTIQNIVYMSMKNDLAFVIAGVLNLYEHQSSFNPNMPVRFFIYLGQEFQMMIGMQKADIYGRKLIKLPTPRCVVFYNGDTDEPEERILRLSDAYEQPEETPQVELTVRMININFGHNRELMEKCRKLWEYAYFVDQINQRLKAGVGMKLAVNQAVDHCIDRDILGDILRQNKMEVVGMLLTEFNERKYKKFLKKISREEGYADGHEEGIRAGREEGLRAGREEGLRAGRVEGRKEALDEGICALAETCRELGVSKESTLEKIMQKFSVSQVEAGNYIERVWK